MAKGSIDYHKKIEQMLMEMPDFVSDFIYKNRTNAYGNA